MTRFSYLTHLECGRCRQRHDSGVPQGVCSSCGSPLLARYDISALARDLSPKILDARPGGLWRYHEMLPVASSDAIVSFGEPTTPLLPLPRLGAKLGIPNLLMKDESFLPTGTFKSRGAAVGVARAAELGIRAVAMPTNGNAGAAWSAYCARAGIGACVVMPQDAPLVARRECMAAGARVYVVDGLIGDAGGIVSQLAATSDWFDASTLKEPYRLEGKKTMGLEIVEQLGWRVPDVIVYPTGGGVGIIGIYKALRELQEMGWIRDTMPRLVAVQAAGCAPIVEAFNAGATSTRVWPSAHTIAFGITVPKPLGDFLILDALYQTQGRAVAVDDDMLLCGVRDMALLEGALICPEGGATVAAALQLRNEGWIGEDDEVVLLNTGAGVIYSDVLPGEYSTIGVGEQIDTDDLSGTEDHASI